MGEIIQVKNENGELLVSARELHKGLDISERFNSWFERMLKYGFEEDIDFTGVKSFTVVNNGARKEIDEYILKLDCAKEISMIQRNEKGKQIRKYFIECEKKLKEQHLQITEKEQCILSIYNGGQDGILASKRLVEIETKPLIDKIEKDKPKVTFADNVIKSKDNVTVTVLAKMISDKGFSISNRKLYDILRNWGYIFKKSRLPIQKYIEKGYFVLDTYVVDTMYGCKEEHNVKVTPLGQLHIVERVLEEGINN